jgi:hypothetical protein
MSAIIGGVILLGLWAVWLDHRRKREAAREARVRDAQRRSLIEAAIVADAVIAAAQQRESARAQHPSAAPKGAAALRALTDRQKN